MNFYILTLFPEMVMNGLMTSITGRAIQQNKIGVEAVDIRDFTEEKHGRVDDYTYGGGAGMLMQAQPVYDAFESVRERIPKSHKKRVIYVTPQGCPFTQQMAEDLAQNDDLVLICGHYEGVDERVLEDVATDYISIGDYVLTGGELAAMVIVDAVSRLVPSVLHNEISPQTESFCGNLLEYPQYSRPEEWHGKRVPPVLLSGNQREIDKWRRQEAEARTAERRPDLYACYLALQDCEKSLLSDKLHHMDMIGLIRRGRAVLIERRDDEILLEDRKTHVWYHTCLRDIEKVKAGQSVSGKHALEKSENSILPEQIEKLHRNPAGLVCHQAGIVSVLVRLGYRLGRKCLQCVCTRREQLPISGLYSADGRNPQTGLAIRKLTSEQVGLVSELIRVCADQDRTGGEQQALFMDVWGGIGAADLEKRLRHRMERGFVYGAYMGEMFVGVVAEREDGCMDLLAASPKYRGQKVAAALETYLFNRQIREGMTPYGQAEIGNGAFLALQECLGVHVAKEPVYWMEI